MPSVLFQPMAADDVVDAIVRIAVGKPLEGVVEIGGPEPFRMDELIRETLAAKGDAREVITDPAARYYGALLSERTLVPGDGAQLSETTYDEWRMAREGAGTR